MKRRTFLQTLLSAIGAGLFKRKPAEPAAVFDGDEPVGRITVIGSQSGPVVWHSDVYFLGADRHTWVLKSGQMPRRISMYLKED